MINFQTSEFKSHAINFVQRWSIACDENYKRWKRHALEIACNWNCMQLKLHAIDIAYVSFFVSECQTSFEFSQFRSCSHFRNR